MSEESIRAFLNYGKRPIDKGWITTAFIINIVAFMIGIIFSEHKIVNGVLGGVCSGCLIVCYIKAIRGKMSEDLLNLWYGIFMTCLSISLNYASFIFNLKIVGNSMLLATILFVASFAVASVTFLRIYWGIKNSRFIGKKESNISKSIIAIGVCSATVLYRSRKQYLSKEHIGLILSVLIALFAILMASNVWFIIKYYYYKLLDRKDGKEKSNN